MHAGGEGQFPDAFFSRRWLSLSSMLSLLLLLLLSRDFPCLFWRGRIVSIMPTSNGDNENKTETKPHHPLGASQKAFLFCASW